MAEESKRGWLARGSGGPGCPNVDTIGPDRYFQVAAKWLVRRCGSSNSEMRSSRFAKMRFARRSKRAGNRPKVESLSMVTKCSIASTPNLPLWSERLLNEGVCAHQARRTRPGPHQALSRRERRSNVARQVIDERAASLSMILQPNPLRMSGSCYGMRDVEDILK